METLYDFITSRCKERNMKIEDLQKTLGVSRTTLYRYMKGINHITPDLKESFVKALNMDAQEALVFSKYVSQSAIDHSLIESRYVIDDFLFRSNPARKAVVDIDMIFYNNDKYLRTLSEILGLILSYSSKDKLSGNIKIVNCLNDNIFLHIADFLERVFSNGLGIEAEHFVGLSGSDYLQNTFSFINIFPFMKYEKYRLYYREKEIEDGLINDSILISLIYEEDGKSQREYFSMTFYDQGMSECVSFTDPYMYNFLSKGYDNLKRSFSSVIQKYESMDPLNDILLEASGRDSNYIIKPNPCYDKIPYEVFESLIGRMRTDELIQFLSLLFGKQLDSDTVTGALASGFEYMKKRLENSKEGKQIDVYSRQGLLEFVETGKVTDHLAHMAPLDSNEIKIVLDYLCSRADDPNDDYRLYITEEELSSKEFVLLVLENYGILIEYVYSNRDEGLWKILLIESKRLASIFCDYIENHVPVAQAMPRDKAESFLQSLIDSL